MKKISILFFLLTSFFLFNIANANYNNENKGQILKDQISLSRAPFCSIINSQKFFATQGMCVAGDYLIVSHFAGNYLSNRLYVIDIKNRKVVSQFEAVLGHINSMCYNTADGCIYIPDGNKVHKIKLNGFSLGNIEEIPSFRRISSMTCDNGMFLCNFPSEVNSERKIYKTRDFQNYELMYNVQYDIGGQTTQGMAVDKHFIYLPTSGKDSVERIFVFDKHTGKRVTCYSYPRRSFAEIEDVDVYNGYIFINTNRYSGAVYKVPLYTGTPEDLDRARMSESFGFSGRYKNFDDIYVDNSVVVAFPDGTTKKPFNNYYDAIALVVTRNLPCTIHIKGAYPDITIRGVNKKINLDLSQCKVANSLSIYDSQVKITGNFTANKINMFNSFVDINGGFLVGNNAIDTPITASRSVLIGNIHEIKNYTNQIVADGENGFAVIHVNKHDYPVVKPDSSTVLILNNALISTQYLMLGSDTNLNTCIDIYKKYSCSKDTVAESLTNCPTTLLFTMEVRPLDFSKHDVMQIITDRDANIYTRVFVDGAWSKWKACTNMYRSEYH